jgi:gamma-glutamylcysteine synthetase
VERRLRAVTPPSVSLDGVCSALEELQALLRRQIGDEDLIGPSQINEHHPKTRIKLLDHL